MFSGQETTHLDAAIAHVEQLYARITGREPPAPNGSYAAIPPEKDPVTHVEEAMARLRQVLSAEPPKAPVAAAPSFVPAIMLFEGETEYVLRVDVPGVQKADLQIALTGNMLSVLGERGVRCSDGLAARAVEPAHGRFARQITLGQGVRYDSAVARLEGGVLEIRVPKGPAGQPASRLIEIT